MATKRRSTVALLVRVDPEVLQALKEQAIRERRTMSNVTAYAIRKYIRWARARPSEEDESEPQRKHA
jgi:predicted transcriptional regulator